jgi:hypothetical protein
MPSWRSRSVSCSALMDRPGWRPGNSQRELLAELVEDVAAEPLDLDAITRALAGETVVRLADLGPGDVVDALDDDPYQSWRAAIRKILSDRQDDEHDMLRARIAELLRQHTTT